MNTLKLPLRYELSVSDQQLAERIGSERFWKNRQSNVPDHFIGDQGDLTDYEKKRIRSDISAFGGELAACRVLNLQPDLNTEIRSGGYDAKFASLHTLEVKCTPYSKGQLWCEYGRFVKHCNGNPIADVSLLVTGEFPTYVLAGWAWTTELIRPDRVDKLRGRIEDTFLMKQEELCKEFYPWY